MVVVEIALGREGRKLFVDCPLKLRCRAVKAWVNELVLKHLFTEEGEPAALGVADDAEIVYIEIIGFATRKRQISQVAQCRRVEKLVVIQVYRVVHMVGCYGRKLLLGALVKVAVVITEARALRHRMPKVIKHGVSVALEEEAVEVRPRVCARLHRGRVI